MLENPNIQTSSRQAEETNGGEWSTTITPSFNGQFSVEIDEDLPAGWSSSVKIAGVEVTNDGTIPLSMQNPSDIDVEMFTASGSVKGRGDVTVTITGDRGTRFSRSFRLYANDLEAIVLQRDEGREEIAGYFDRALLNGVHRYAIVEPEDEDLFSWKDHVVIYEVGKWALTADEIPRLKAFIDDEDSKLFIVGAEIGYGLVDTRNNDSRTPRDEAFMEQYLHATYVNDDNPNSTVNGISNDPVGDGLSFSIATGVRNQDTPDQIAPASDAVPAFYYGSDQNQVAGIRFADQSDRLIYLGFGPEGIGDENARASLLTQGITWLLSSDVTTNVEYNEDAALSMIREVAPNPAHGDVIVSLSLDNPKDVRIMLYDLHGRVVYEHQEIEERSGDFEVHLGIHNLPSGTYRLVVQKGEVRESKPITILR